jgi:quercetin dioxygenase-like cupin family protein
MKSKVILNVEEKHYQEYLKDNEFPSEVANLLACKFDFNIEKPQYSHFKDVDNEGVYVFVSQKCSSDFDVKVNLEDLYLISDVHKGKSKSVLETGDAVYDVDETGFSGYFPLPEKMTYMCVGAYPSGAVGGSHFHYRKVEYLYPTEGDLNVRLQLVKDSAQEISFTLSPGQILMLLPGVKHWVTPIGDKASLLEFSPNRYDKKDYPKA